MFNMIQHGAKCDFECPCTPAHITGCVLNTIWKVHHLDILNFTCEILRSPKSVHIECTVLALPKITVVELFSHEKYLWNIIDIFIVLYSTIKPHMPPFIETKENFSYPLLLRKLPNLI